MTMSMTKMTMTMTKLATKPAVERLKPARRKDDENNDNDNFKCSIHAI